jgi:hypothetical protein
MMLAIMAIAAIVDASAQTSERRGTMALLEGRKYMVAFPQVWNSPTETPLAVPMQLFISSKSKANVKVRTVAASSNASGINRNFTVDANKVLKVPISISMMNKESETRNGYGIEVTADRPISVSTFQAWNGNGELARHLPVEAWGKNYYTMNFYQDRYGAGSNAKYRPSQILIIAEKNGTVINYRPTVDTEGGGDAASVRAGQTGQVTLDRGETFLIKSKIDEAKNKLIESDMSGTFITGSKPFGVISGHTKVAIMRYPDVLPPTGMFATEAHFVRNNVHDAMLPLEMAGTEFVTIPCRYTPSRVTGQAAQDFGVDDDRGDVIRFIALEDNTTVSVMSSNGSGFQNVRRLKRGETFYEIAQQTAAVWRSDKPILMGQYGKSWAKLIPPAFGADKGENSQGHPTVESGMPMLQYVPSIDRWVNYGVFSAPEGMDNFVNIVFKTDEANSITYDGRPILSAFGGSMRPLPGSNYSFIQAQVAAGDHVIDSKSESVKWAAWTYGSLDGLNQGRAYGTPIAIDLSVPCDDSLTVEETIVCGDVTGKGKIVPENSACGSLFAVYAEELANYELVVSEEFSGGDKTVDFTVNVLDKTKDAQARVLVVTRSGKFVEKTYTYVADKIAFDPKSFNFGVVSFNDPKCTDITITNLNDRPVTIEQIRAKAFPDVFSFTPSNVTIPANGSVQVRACGVINDARERIDTVILELACFDVPATELRIRGALPTIIVGDRNWGRQPANGEYVRPVEIVNTGSTPVRITGFDAALLDQNTSNFYNPTTTDGRPLASVMPLDIAGNARYTFNVTYSPKGVAGVPHRVDVPFYSNAQGTDTIAVLEGEGVLANVAAAGFSWNERVIDRTVTATDYRGSVSVQNTGSAPITVNRVSIRGDVHGVFSIVPGIPGDLIVPSQVASASTRQNLTVAFKPTEKNGRAAERNDYVAEVVFEYTDNGETKEAVAALDARAWQPQIKINNLVCADFTRVDNGPNDIVYTGTITIRNEHPDGTTSQFSGTAAGSGPLKVNEIRLTSAAVAGLTITQPAGGEELIPSGEERTYAVRIANPIASQSMTFTIVGDQPYDANGTMEICVPNNGTWEVAGGRGETYINMETVVNASITNTTNAPKAMTVSVTGADAVNFTVDPNFENIVVPAGGQSMMIPVIFKPNVVSKFDGNQQTVFNSTNTQRGSGTSAAAGQRPNEYVAEVVFTDVATNETKTAPIAGNGLVHVIQARIADAYKIQPGQTIGIAVELKADPDALNRTDVRDMKFIVAYDPNIVQPRISEITTNGTVLQGWNVVKVDTYARSIEVFVQGSAAATAPNTDWNRALIIPFDGFLGRSSDFANDPMSVQLGLRAFSVTPAGQESNPPYEHHFTHSINGKVTLELNCANVRRLTAIGSTNFAVKASYPNPATTTTVINYSIGLDGQTKIVLFNSMGQRVADLVNSTLGSGEYDLTVDVSQLPAGTYYYQIVSGPFVSEPQSLTIVR